jgi:hypothetical protein
VAVCTGLAAFSSGLAAIEQDAQERRRQAAVGLQLALEKQSR